MLKKSGKKKIIELIVLGTLGVMCIACILLICTKGTNNMFVKDTVSPEPTAAQTQETTEPLQAEEMPAVGNGLYINNKTLTATNSRGGTLSVGVNSANTKGLVLAPQYKTATPTYKIGYYIVSSMPHRFTYSQKDYCDINSPGIINSSNVIVDWTYDKLKTADYINDEDYGVCWSIDIDDPTISDDNFKLVVVDMTTHNLLSSFTVVIRRNADNKFEIADLFDNDISNIPTDKLKAIWDYDIDNSSTKNAPGRVSNDDLTRMSFEEVDIASTRQKLLDLAMSEINSGNYITVEEPFNFDNAIVELTENTYHQKYLAFNHTVGYTGRVTYPVWAVTVNSKIPSIGHYTLYFAKENMDCIGSDFFYLSTEEELNSYKKE